MSQIIVEGHRGYCAKYPENTLISYRKAMELGVDAMEFDVWLSKDNVPVIMHDGNAKRTAGVDRNLNDMTLEEIKSCPLTVDGERIPTLYEVLCAIRGRVPLLIELKGEGRDYLPETVADVLAGYEGKYAIQSFNPYYLYRFRRIVPRVPVGFLAVRKRGEGIRDRIFALCASHLLFNFAFRPDFISYRYSDKLPFSVRLCRRLGAPLLLWTVSDKEAMRRHLAVSDGIIAENLSELLSE